MPDTHRDEIEKLEALYASNPAGRVFTHLAEALRKAGDYPRSREILEAGLTLHPDYPGAHVVMGRLQLDMGEREGAATSFRNVLELDRHNLIALRALGDLAVEAGRFEEARHYFGELIQIDPGDIEIAERLGSLPEEVTESAEAAWLEADWPEPGMAEPEAEREVAEPAPADGGAAEAESEAWGLPAGSAFEAAAESIADEVEPAPRAWLEPEPVGGDAEDSLFVTIEPAAESPAGEPGPVQEPPEDAGGRPHVQPPLDAWVESLNVLDAELDLREPADVDIADAESAFPGLLPAGAAVVPPDAFGAAAPDPETSGADEPDPAPEWVVETSPADEPEPAPEMAEEPSPGDAAERFPELGLDTWPEGEAGPIPGTEVPPAEEAGQIPESELASAWWGDPEIHGSVPDPVEWVSQEDWERIAAYGTWSGTAADEEPVEAVPPIESEWDSGRDEDADEVATETLAEVYAAQGFRAEAAEIYRKLLRRRPDDPRLVSRLSALESEPEPEPDAVAGYEEEFEPAVMPAVDPWLEVVEPGWPGSDEHAEAGPTPYAWIEDGAAPEPGEGGTIGERLRGLLSWQPVAVPDPEPTIVLEDVAEAAPPEFPSFAMTDRGSAGGLAPPPAPDAEEDRDLEMFRSWLKSLRK